MDLRRIRMRIFVRMRQAAVATRQLFLRRDAAAERINMDNRIAMVSIIVENDESYREAGLSLISIAACAPVDRINALTGSLGRLPGVSAKAVYASAKRHGKNGDSLT